MTNDAAEIARFTARLKTKATRIKVVEPVNMNDRYNALEEKYGEPTRVPQLYGWDRWMATFQGPAVDDLAGRSYTLMELHEAVTVWLFDLGYDDLKDELDLRYDIINDIPCDFDTLTELYKKLWNLREERSELSHTKPYWK